MMPINVFVSERRAANLLEQVRWRDGVYCPRCRAEAAIQYGSYRQFQRYRCKNCDRTFNDMTDTVVEYSSIKLRKWFLAVYTYIRLNTSIRQLEVEIDVSYKTVYRRVQRFLRALDAPQLLFEGSVEIDELYVTAGLKGRERDGSHLAEEHITATMSPCSHSLTAGLGIDMRFLRSVRKARE